MLKSIAGFLAVFALAAPMAAQAQSLSAADFFATFQRVCLATQGDRTLALQAMDSSGWIIAPTNILPQLPEGFSNVEARMASAPDAMLIAFVGEAAQPEDETPSSVCAMSIMPAVAGVDEQLGSWAGGEPLGVDAGNRMYLFRTDRADHEAVTEANLSDAEALALARSGHMFAVVGRTEARGVMLMRMSIPR